MSHPIRQFLAEAGYNLTDAGDYWRTSAKFRGGQNATSVAIEKRTGKFKDFANPESRWESPEVLVKLITGNQVDFSGYEIIPEREKIKVIKVYPKEILKRLVPHFDLFINRGISEKTMREFDAGMAHAGKLNRRICFPIYDRHTRIIGFSGRWFQEKPPYETVQKWKHLSPKTSFLWPAHLNDFILREEREVILIESIGDGLALWEAGIKNFLCIFGTSISSKQLSYIIGVNPQRIIIATNNDSINEYGIQPGQVAAQKLENKLNKHFDEAKIITALPPKNDFGVMNGDEIRVWYKDIS